MQKATKLFEEIIRSCKFCFLVVQSILMATVSQECTEKFVQVCHRRLFEVKDKLIRFKFMRSF